MSERIPLTPEREVSPERLARNISFFLTKPENTGTDVPLLLFLKAQHLTAKIFRVVLDQEKINILYSNIKDLPEISHATNEHMRDKEVEVFLVSKDSENTSNHSVLDEVVDLVGDKTDPEDNNEDSLRRRFHGDTREYVNGNGKTVRYFENGFHRPKTSEELVTQLKALGLLEEAKILMK